ncbi:MAG: YbfB/YjiJ family MFS transporter [Magnetococcales bacterium]|nr:YbfB/YjiJ family MFS transporter [Magnetococcales bacterium]
MKKTYQIILAGVVINLVSMGIARFAYTPFLPAMLLDGLSLDAAGMIASVNYVGYLSGAILSIMIVNVVAQKWLLRFGMLLCLITSFLMAYSESVIIWAVVRFFAGVGSALGMVVGSAFVLKILQKHNEAKKTPIQFAGVGLGIAISGVVSMLLVSDGDWRLGWISLGVFSLIVTPLAMWIVEHNSDYKIPVEHKIINSDNKIPPFVWFLFAAYFCEGIGYVVSGTFLPTIINEIAGLKGAGDSIWIVVGLAAAPSCIFWAMVANKLGSAEAIMLALLVQTVGVIIPVFSDSAFLNLVGAFLYGGTFLGIVSMTLSFGGRLGDVNPARIIGILTIAFGAGQVIGPLYATALTQWQGSYDAALILTCAIILLGWSILWRGRVLLVEKV